MKRVLTALFLFPVGIYSALFAPWWVFVAVVALVSGISFHEYAKMTGSFAPIGFIAGGLVLLMPIEGITPILIFTCLAALVLPLASPEPRKSVAASGMLMMGIIYVFGAWKTGIRLHDISLPVLPGISAGQRWLFFALMVNWVGDSGAYYVGRRWGRHKMAPVVSPGKSWEGAAASSAAATALGAIYLSMAIPTVSPAIGAVIGFLANASGQIGDLVESAIKRAFGVKDSGSILPGHGGMLDRLDSSMFSMPAVWGLIGLFHLAK